jgi:hypothetical protein
LKLDPPLSFLYIHRMHLWATISAQCKHLKNSCFALPTPDI